MPTPEELQAEVDKMREALEKANGEAATRRKEAQALKDQLKSFEGIDPEAFRETQNKLNALEEERMKAAGQFDELVKRKETEHSKIVEQLTSRQKELESKYQRVVVDERLLAAFAKHGAVDPSDAVALTRGSIGLDDNGVFIKGADGSPVIVDGKRQDLESFAQTWLQSKPHFMKANGGGSGSTKGGGGTAKSISRADFDAMDHIQRMEAVKSGVKVTD